MRDLVGICHDRLSEAHGFGCGGLQVALQASPSLAWSCTQYAISDGGVAAADLRRRGTVGCGGGGHIYGMRKRGEFGIFFVIL